MQLCLLIYMFKFTIIGDVEQLIRSEIYISYSMVLHIIRADILRVA